MLTFTSWTKFSVYACEYDLHYTSHPTLVLNPKTLFMYPRPDQNWLLASPSIKTWLQIKRNNCSNVRYLMNHKPWCLIQPQLKSKNTKLNKLLLVQQILLKNSKSQIGRYDSSSDLQNCLSFIYIRTVKKESSW